MSMLPAVKLWIWWSVFASVAGWTLSTVGMLNRLGYAAMAVIAILVFIESRARGQMRPFKMRWGWRRIRARFCRPFPLMFALLAALILLGGLLYPPTNHTGLSYRIPRVLHWLNADHWFWIYAPNHRMNTRACGIEWLSAPILLFARSDRGLFLLNFIPFLLLPGLIFSMLTRLSVRARVAWQWMWLLPTGYVFLLQAGSAGNDAYPAVYALAAMDFAARAWKSRHPGDLWYSLLAIALLNGAKASNLPLVLPWLVLVGPLWRVLIAHPLGTVRVALLALLGSFVPTALLNVYYCGDWSGLKLERAGMDMHNPIVGVFGNAFLLLLNNLCPPFFPLAGWWNQHALQILPGLLLQPMNTYFEQGYHWLWELPTEDWAGIGPGVCALMMLSGLWTFYALWKRQVLIGRADGIPRRVVALALIAPWIALLAYSAKSGMVTPARLIAPYYPLILPALLLGASQSQLVRRRWWRSLAWAVFIVAFAVLIVTPARPLWPAKTILGRVVATDPDNRLAQRALKAYAVYAVRADALAPMRELLPADLKWVGFVGTADDLDLALWRPFGTRSVHHISLADSAESIRARKLQYAVVSGLQVELERVTLEDWLARIRAEVVAQRQLEVTVSAGNQSWYLVKFAE